MRISRRKLRRLGLHLIAIIICAFGFFPFVWITSASFKSQQELFTTLPSLLPHHPVWTNYIYVLKGIGGIGAGSSGGSSLLLILYRNTVFVTLSSVFLITTIVSLAAYALARLKFRGRDALFYFFIVLMFLPSGGGLMATYELMHFLHLRNKLTGLILLFSAGGGGVALFLMRQVFLNIPSQLEDAARVDGASNLRICFQIMMPLAAGGMILVAVMQFVSVWGDYLTCRIMIDYADKMTLAYGMQFLYVVTPASGVASSYGAQATAIIFTVLPTVLVFILLQKWFIRGALEGLKM